MATSSGRRPYDPEHVFLAEHAVQEANLQHVRIVAADKAGLLAVHESVARAFPRRGLGKLDIPNTAFVMRLAGLDYRFNEAASGVPYCSARDIHPRTSEIEMFRYVSKLMIQHVHGNEVVDITVPSVLDNPSFGTAYVRGLLEYCGAVTPSDEITGDAERARLSPKILDLMDAAQAEYPHLFVAINGTIR